MLQIIGAFYCVLRARGVEKPEADDQSDDWRVCACEESK